MSAVNFSMPTGEINALARAKLAAFEDLRGEFEGAFLFVQEVHGQRRFATFPVDHTVRYLHALWVCECKDRLLSIPKTIERYEGAKVLELLRRWQTGETGAVVRFLQAKLDAQPFADLTREYEDVWSSGDRVLAERLAHGRLVLLNRAFNLHVALDALFTLDHESLLARVRAACKAHGHTLADLDEQMSRWSLPLYSYAPHPALARQNMIVMMAMGVAVTDNPEDVPGARTQRVMVSSLPLKPYADQVILGEHLLLSMFDNNPQHLDEAMPPLAVDAPDLIQPRKDHIGPTGEHTEDQSSAP